MRLLLLFGLMLCVVPRVCSAGPAEELPIVQAGPDYVPGFFVGRIVNLSKDSLVIRPERGGSEETTTTLPNGKPARLVYYQDNTRPPQEFVFHDCLFPDRPGSKAPRFYEHNVGELQCGDVVAIQCAVLKGVRYCTHVAIIRRPNGKVPPAIGDDRNDREWRLDVRCNAEQFIEEKVIPIKLPRLFAQMHR